MREGEKEYGDSGKGSREERQRERRERESLTFSFLAEDIFSNSPTPNAPPPMVPSTPPPPLPAEVTPPPTEELTPNNQESGENPVESPSDLFSEQNKDSQMNLFSPGKDENVSVHLLTISSIISYNNDSIKAREVLHKMPKEEKFDVTNKITPLY